MKKIKGMKDGKPKYAANQKVRELRYAIDILKQVGLEDELDEAFEDGAKIIGLKEPVLEWFLIEMGILKPPA